MEAETCPGRRDDSMEILGYYVVLTAVFIGAVLVYSFANIVRGPSMGKRCESGESPSRLSTCQSSAPKK